MLSLLATTATASLLIRDAHNPCVAYGNATIFNITSLFRWPAVVTGPPDYDNKKYQYSWACGGLAAKAMANGSHTACADNDTAVCQHDPTTGLEYNAGALSTALWLGAAFNGEPTEWTILYPNTQRAPPSPYSGIGGAGIRLSRVHFVVDKSVASPQLSMLGEEPFTEYQLEVRGACIGQPDWDSPKRYC
jgi:hypothetical protein